MAQFLAEHASAIFALMGTLVGGMVSYVGSWFLRRRDLDLRLWERFLDRRISAHEAVVGLALKMRVMASLEEFDSDGNLIRAPNVMVSREAFEEWLTEFAQVSVPATTWLSIVVKRELNLVQDFMVTLHSSLTRVPSERFLTVGTIVYQDFLDFSSSLERIAFQFFESEARKLKLPELAEHHKYAFEETQLRLQKTVMMSKWTDIQRVIQSATQDHNVES